MERFQQDWEMSQRFKRLNKNGMWAWAFASVDKARATRDPQRMLMINLLLDGGEQMNGNFDHGLEVLGKGRIIGERLGEHWWVMLFDHWRLQLLLKKGDYPLARELVMHMVEEVRKPLYDGLGLRVCINEDLIRMCIETDPAGYTRRITKALSTMATLVSPGSFCYRCLHSNRVDFAKETENWDDMEQGLEYLLNLDAGDSKSLVIHHTNLCRLAYERRNWPELRKWIAIGEEFAGRVERVDCMAEFLAWKAFVVSLEGDSVESEHIAQAAVTAAAKGPAQPHRDFYDAICAYYQSAGALDRALDARFQHLKYLTGMGRLAHELHTREEICRLLAAQGKSPKNQLMAARKVAQSLIDPAPARDRLDTLARDGTTR